MFGLAASSIYWVRMIGELQWIRINNVNRDSSVQYDQNFLFSTHSQDDPTVWWVNILTVVTFLLFAPALALFFRSARNQIKFRRLIPVAILALVTFFMALPLSRPLWRVLPALQQVQFPWRWLAHFVDDWLFAGRCERSALAREQNAMATSASFVGAGKHADLRCVHAGAYRT